VTTTVVGPRTSLTDPLDVGWLPLRTPGRLGLTIAPGKKGVSQTHARPWSRDLDVDLQRLRDVHGCSLLVCLVEDAELRAYGITDLVAGCARARIELQRFPIRDVDVPRPGQDTPSLVAAIRAALHGGRSVVVHCIGGLGRSGTIGGCVLVAEGVPVDEAYQSLRAARGPSCPETEAQRRFIASFAAR
jgi:protein-tyrosine phosphatase